MYAAAKNERRQPAGRDEKESWIIQAAHGDDGIHRKFLSLSFVFHFISINTSLSSGERIGAPCYPVAPPAGWSKAATVIFVAGITILGFLLAKASNQARKQAREKDRARTGTKS